MTDFRKLSASACMAAAISMAATPAIAADIPLNTAPKTPVAGAMQWDAEATNVEHRRGRYHRHRRHRGVDAGDVIAGVLILGGIAAIASAASDNKRERRSYPVREPRYDDRRGNARSGGGQGIDRAVDMCLREIERDVRVDNVDNVSRTGEGWFVTGSIYNGDSFSCQINNDGRVENVSIGGRVAAHAPAGATEDRQWDDERYREARQQIDEQDEAQYRSAQVEPEQPTGPQPAYPGGPVDGDLEQDGELGG